MPETPRLEYTLVDLERQISEAAQLRIALSRGEVARIKRDVRAFLEESAMLRDLVPERWWRAEHTSTEALLDALAAAKTRIGALPTDLLPGLSLLTDAYIERADRLVKAQDAGTKTEVKTEALDYLEHAADAEVKRLYPVGRLREMVGRRNHVASKSVLEALLKARAKIDVSNQSAHAEAERHILSIDPFAGKAHFKLEVLFLFETHFTRSRLPSTMGYQRFVRKSHAPARDLLKALTAAKTALDAVKTPEARSALVAKIDHLSFLLRERKKMQTRVAECTARAERMRSSLESSQGHVAKMLEGVKKKRAELAAQLAANEAENDRAGAALLRVQAQLEAARDELARQGENYEVERAAGASDTRLAALTTELGKIERQTHSLELDEQALLSQIDTLKAKATALLVTLDQLAQVELHCTDKAVSIQHSLVRAKEAFAKYEQVKTLVFYFGTRDNIFEKLLAVGRFLKGGRDEVDAMGNIAILFMFEAGVRVGVELGIVNMNAKVALTLMLGGGLGILDSREMMFSHRVGVYATASAEASVGGGKQLGELLHAPIAIPEKLIEASARARCRLYDSEACHVYESEEHWAFTWAHEIARRIAFLRGYTVTDPECEREGGDWVERSLNDLIESGITASDSVVTPREGGGKDWRNMLKVEASLLTQNLRDKPVRVVRFAQPVKLEGSAKASLVGLGEQSFDRETPIGEATFDASVEVTGTKTPLGTLVEDSAIYSYAAEGDRRMGATIFHRFKKPGQREDEPGTIYLELTDKEANRVGTETFNFQWSASTGETVGTAAQRCALARVLRDAKVPKDFARKVGMPALVAGSKPPTPDDLTALAKTMRIQLDLMVGKHKISTLDKAVNQVFALPETAKGIGEKLTTVASTLEKAPTMLRSSPIPDSLRAPTSAFVESVASRVVPIAQGASAIASEVADKTSFLSSIQVALGASSSSYARYIGQPRFTLKSGRLEWKTAWAPQVFRGTNLKTFTLKLEKDIPIVPLVNAFLKFELQFRKEFAEYEVLGLDTLSYVKTVHASFRGKGDRSKRYWDLHGEELVEICRNGANADSGVFAEIVHDATKGPEEAKTAARAFGRACWATFLPSEPNPFARSGPFDAAAVAMAEKLTERVRAAQADRTPTGLAAHRDVLVTADTPEAMLESWRVDVDAAADIVKKYAAGFTKVGRPEPGPAPEAARELASVVTARTAQKKEDARKFAAGFASLDERGLKTAATELSNAFSASNAIDEQEHAWLWARAFAAPSDFSGRLRDAAVSPEPARDIVGDLLRPLLERLGEGTKIPDSALWLSRSRENISYFQVRSTATKTLDTAVSTFHTSLGAWQRDVLASLRSRRTESHSMSKDDWQSYLARLRTAIEARVAMLATLEDALRTWRGDRDPGKSERMPNVCMFLERPLRIERAVLRVLERLLAIRIRIADHLTRKLVLARIGEPAPSNIALLRGALDKYLEATYSDFAYHALFHGIKKLQLPGEEREIEKIEDEAPPKPKGSSLTAPTISGTSTASPTRTTPVV